MRRVVVTGLGIVSCIGNDAATVTESLKKSLSGIRANETYTNMGFRSQVSGRPTVDLEAFKGDRVTFRAGSKCPRGYFIAG